MTETQQPMTAAAIRRQAETAIAGRAAFEAHVRKSTKPLRMDLDPRDVIALLAEVDRLRAELAGVQQQAASAALQAAADSIYGEWPGGTGHQGLTIMWAEDWLQARAAAADTPRG